MTQHFHEIDCAGCDWSMSPVIGSIEDLAGQVMTTIGAHTDGTGHTVRITVFTFGALGPDSVEQTAVLVSPRPGDGQPAGRLEP